MNESRRWLYTRGQAMTRIHNIGVDPQIMDRIRIRPDADPGPSIFTIDIQDANKKLI